jgi:hypothetical protein
MPSQQRLKTAAETVKFWAEMLAAIIAVGAAVWGVLQRVAIVRWWRSTDVDIAVNVRLVLLGAIVIGLFAYALFHVVYFRRRPVETPQAPRQPTATVEPGEIEILTILANEGATGAYKDALRNSVKLPITTFDYHMDRLLHQFQLIDYSFGRFSAQIFKLTARGREFAVRNKLVRPVKT